MGRVSISETGVVMPDMQPSEGRSFKDIIHSAVKDFGSQKIIPEDGLKMAVVTLLASNPRYKELQNAKMTAVEIENLQGIIKRYNSAENPVEKVAESMLEFLVMNRWLEKSEAQESN